MQAKSLCGVKTVLGVISSRNAAVRERIDRILGLTEDSTRRLPSSGNWKEKSAGAHNSKASGGDAARRGKWSWDDAEWRSQADGKLPPCFRNTLLQDWSGGVWGLCHPEQGTPGLLGQTRVQDGRQLQEKCVTSGPALQVKSLRGNKAVLYSCRFIAGVG